MINNLKREETLQDLRDIFFYPELVRRLPPEQTFRKSYPLHNGLRFI